MESQFIVELLNSPGSDRHFVLVELEIKESFNGALAIRLVPSIKYELTDSSYFWQRPVHREEIGLDLRIGSNSAEASFSAFLILAGELRGIGLGTYMMTKLISICQSLTSKPIKVNGIKVYGEEDGGRRMAFYRNLGFHLDEEEPNMQAWASISDLRDLRSGYNPKKVREISVGEFFYSIMKDYSEVTRHANQARDVAERFIGFKQLSLFKKIWYYRLLSPLSRMLPDPINNTRVLPIRRSQAGSQE